MPDDKRLIHSIRLQNLLSFGPSSEEIRLEALNVIIGPNATGKSNLIEIIGLLQSLPQDLTLPVRDGGGIGEWLWKGSSRPPIAEIDVTIDYPEGAMPLRHKLSITTAGQRLELVDEAVENIRPEAHHEDVRFFYRYQQGKPTINVCLFPPEGPEAILPPLSRKLRRNDNLKHNQSVLSQLQGPEYPEISYLKSKYEAIRLYREWNLGRYTPLRQPQPADLPADFLMDDCRNLGMVLNDLEHKHGFPNYFLEKLQLFNNDFTHASTRVLGGTVQVYLHEKNLEAIPATRLSDGTLRYLCLLCILGHPTPPPLICLEEPEIGLHPDILPAVAELLIEASQRTQLIVTTHSDVLVDALTEIPEAVVVCEKENGQTAMKRLSEDDLATWLQKYTLGQLWRKGELGGNRW
ncbi:MAG: AAA family ATPase [Deltaproteobacteria bacterium]|nr:AAA family ATPase [Deltaproteobacteria bacterium]